MGDKGQSGSFQSVKIFFRSFIDLWNTSEFLRLSNIRLKFLQYFFALPLALSFVIIQNDLLAENIRVFGFSSEVQRFIFFAIGAAVMFIIRGAHNMHIVSRVSSALTMAGFIPWLFIPHNGFPAFICTVVYMTGSGCCMANSSSFMMVLNNAERFFGCVLMTIIISFVRLNSDFIRQQTYIRIGLIIIMVIGISVCMYKTKKEDFSDFNKGKFKRFHPSIWLSLYILLSYFTIRVLGSAVHEFDIRFSSPLNSILVVAPALFCVIIQLIFNRSVWIMCNVFFISAIMSYVMVFAKKLHAAYIFTEIKEIGLLVGFYLCACVVNRFCDFRRHKIMELVCIFTLGAVFVISDILLRTSLTLTVAVIVSSALFLIFLLLSPAFSLYLFSADWSLQFAKLHMSEIKAQVALSRDSAESGENAELLSSREIDIALLLIEGKSRSEITRSLHLSAAEADRRLNSIRGKIGQMSDSDPVIAAAITEYKLTNREIDMLRCLRRSMTNAEIAEELFLSEETVKIHVRNLLKKLKITTRKDINSWEASLVKPVNNP